MRKLISFIIALLLFCPNLWAATKSAQEIISRLEQKENGQVKLPKIKKGKIKKGFKYYILPNHELPIARALVLIKGGNIFDPSGKSGLSDIATALMRTGGTEDMAPDEMDEYLDTIASSISIGAKREYLAASIVCRSEHFEKSLQLLQDMFFRPRFDKKRFELIKKRFKNSIKRRPDSPDLLAATGFRALLYGKDNPWGTYTTKADIDAITLEDVREFQRDYFHPERMIIGVAGDISPRSVINSIKSYKNYPSDSPSDINPPPADPKPNTGVHFIDKDTTQFIFNVGHDGSYRFNPDKYSLIIMDDMLGGGGFKKRLPQLIRVERGLAYTVWSNFGFGPADALGMFKIYLATKISSAVEALELVVAELKKFAAGEGITENEIKSSKSAILKRLVFEYSSAFGVISNVVRFNYFGYPDNYIEEYGEKIEKVTLGDVKRVSKEYLHPDKLQIVLVGKGANIVKDLKDNFKTSDLIIEE